MVKIPPRKLGPRKLLIAAVGVATINYVACLTSTGGNETSGNLPAPQPGDAAVDNGPSPTSGNLMALPPVDAGADADAALDASDASDAADASDSD